MIRHSLYCLKTKKLFNVLLKLQVVLSTNSGMCIAQLNPRITNLQSHTAAYDCFSSCKLLRLDKTAPSRIPGLAGWREIYIILLNIIYPPFL